MKHKITVLSLTFILLAGFLWCSAGVAQAQTAQAGVFEDLEVQPGAQFEVPVEVRSVEDLYAVDIELQFDPSILQAEDADPKSAGVQAGLGTFLEAGLLLYNDIDNQKGVVRFAMSQVNPAEPVSGDGVFLVLTFVARAEGKTDLKVSFLEAATRLGEGIEIKPSDGKVTVAASAPVFNATPLPVQDLALAIPVPTMAPTEIPTEPLDVGEAGISMAYPESEPEVDTAYPEPQPVDASTAVAAEVEDEDAQASRSILDYWWAVLIVVLATGGLAVYLWLSKKRAVG